MLWQINDIPIIKWLLFCLNKLKIEMYKWGNFAQLNIQYLTIYIELADIHKWYIYFLIIIIILSHEPCFTDLELTAWNWVESLFLLTIKSESITKFFYIYKCPRHKTMNTFTFKKLFMRDWCQMLGEIKEKFAIFLPVFLIFGVFWWRFDIESWLISANCVIKKLVVVNILVGEKCPELMCFSCVAVWVSCSRWRCLRTFFLIISFFSILNSK